MEITIVVISLFLQIPEIRGVLSVSESTISGHTGINLPPLLSEGHSLHNAPVKSRSFTSNPFFGQSASSNIRSIQQLHLESYVSSNQGHTRRYVFGSNPKAKAFPQPTATPCPGGKVLQVDGRCVTPRITRKIYLFDAPSPKSLTNRIPDVPLPKLIENILLVRLPVSRGRQRSLIPPQQRKNYVILLNNVGRGKDSVASIRSTPTVKPEVYIVRYNQDQELRSIGNNGVLQRGRGISNDLFSAQSQNTQPFFITGGDMQKLNSNTNY